MRRKGALVSSGAIVVGWGEVSGVVLFEELVVPEGVRGGAAGPKGVRGE